MLKYPRGLRHQVAGCKLELKIPPGQSLRSKQQTMRLISCEMVYYYHTRISASGRRDTTAVADDEDVMPDCVADNGLVRFIMMSHIVKTCQGFFAMIPCVCFSVCLSINEIYLIYLPGVRVGICGGPKYWPTDKRYGGNFQVLITAKRQEIYMYIVSDTNRNSLWGNAPLGLTMSDLERSNTGLLRF